MMKVRNKSRVLLICQRLVYVVCSSFCLACQYVQSIAQATVCPCVLFAAFEQFNVSHTVNQLSFGPYMPPNVRRSLNLTSQLNGVTRTVTDGYGMFQYYLQVVPTVFRFLNGTSYETYQYSVTEHTRHVDPGSNRGLPGVFFFYEVSALHVEFEEYRRGWTHFFTGVCAAVGGAFTVMGMLDRRVFEWKDRSGGALLER